MISFSSSIQSFLRSDFTSIANNFLLSNLNVVHFFNNFDLNFYCWCCLAQLNQIQDNYDPTGNYSDGRYIIGNKQH